MILTLLYSWNQISFFLHVKLLKDRLCLFIYFDGHNAVKVICRYLLIYEIKMLLVGQFGKNFFIIMIKSI